MAGVKGFLRSGEEVEWINGNLVCVKKPNGKFRLALANSKGVLKSKENKWIYQEEFEYVSEPESYKMIVRFADKSRLVDLLKGVYLTDDKLYIKERVSKKSYLAVKTASNKTVLLNL